jgi:hypothetical protein
MQLENQVATLQRTVSEFTEEQVPLLPTKSVVTTAVRIHGEMISRGVVSHYQELQLRRLMFEYSYSAHGPGRMTGLLPGWRNQHRRSEPWTCQRSTPPDQPARAKRAVRRPVPPRGCSRRKSAQTLSHARAIGTLLPAGIPMKR